MNIYLRRIYQLLNNNINLPPDVVLCELLDLYMANEIEKARSKSIFFRNSGYIPKFLEEVAAIKTALRNALVEAQTDANITVDSLIVKAFNALNIDAIDKNGEIGDLCRAYLTLYPEYIHILDPGIVFHFSPMPYLFSPVEVFKKLIKELKYCTHTSSLLWAIYKSWEDFLISVDLRSQIPEELRTNAILEIIKFIYENPSIHSGTVIHILNGLVMVSSKVIIPDIINCFIANPSRGVLTFFVKKGIFKNNMPGLINVCIELLEDRYFENRLFAIDLLKENINNIPVELIKQIVHKLIINLVKVEYQEINEKAALLLVELAKQQAGSFNQDLIDELILLVNDSESFNEPVIITLAELKFIPNSMEHQDLINKLIGYVDFHFYNSKFLINVVQLLNNVDTNQYPVHFSPNDMISYLISLASQKVPKSYDIADTAEIEKLAIKHVDSLDLNSRERLIQRLIADPFCQLYQLLFKLVFAFAGIEQQYPTAFVDLIIDRDRARVALGESVINFDPIIKHGLIDYLGTCLLQQHNSNSIAKLESFVRIAITLSEDENPQYIDKIMNEFLMVLISKDLPIKHLQIDYSVTYIFSILDLDPMQKQKLLTLIVSGFEKQNIPITWLQFGGLNQMAADTTNNFKITITERLARLIKKRQLDRNSLDLNILDFSNSTEINTLIQYEGNLDTKVQNALCQFIAGNIGLLSDALQLKVLDELIINTDSALYGWKILAELISLGSIDQTTTQNLLNKIVIISNEFKHEILASIIKINTIFPKCFSENMLDNLIEKIKDQDREFVSKLAAFLFRDLAVFPEKRKTLLTDEKRITAINNFIASLTNEKKWIVSDYASLSKLSLTSPLTLHMLENVLRKLLPILNNDKLSDLWPDLMRYLCRFGNIRLDENMNEEISDQLILMLKNPSQIISTGIYDFLKSFYRIKLSNNSSEMLVATHLESLDSDTENKIKTLNFLRTFKFTLCEASHYALIIKLIEQLAINDAYIACPAATCLANLVSRTDDNANKYLIEQIYVNAMNRQASVNLRRYSLHTLKEIASVNPVLISSIIDIEFVLLLQHTETLLQIEARAILKNINSDLSANLKYAILKSVFLILPRVLEIDLFNETDELLDLAVSLYKLNDQHQLRRTITLAYMRYHDSYSLESHKLLRVLLHFHRDFGIEQVLKKTNIAAKDNNIVNKIREYLPLNFRR